MSSADAKSVDSKAADKLAGVEFKVNAPLKVEQVIELYKSAGLVRPIEDSERIEKMYKNSNLVVTAWKDGQLIGVSRSLTDFSYIVYCSDLAVR